ncbi:MAG: CsgG/HfaB family protein [candidate division Zixibacteria bacterium]|nr:CsgG/HfaB family protein [candidate division Zixibacteria bacterium]
MFKSRNSILIGVLVCLLAFGSLVLADAGDNLIYQGNKARITVGKIKPKASKCSRDMGAAIGEMLSTSLANTGKFITLASQEEIDELADEIELGQSGYVEEGRGPEKGLMEGADLLVTGAVTAFEPDAGGSGGILGGFKKKALGGIGASSKEAKIIMDIKLIDIRTRRILKAKSIEAKSKKWKIGMAGGGAVGDVVLGGALGMYSNEPMEKAIRTALAKTIEMVSKEIPDEYYRYQGDGQYTQEYGDDNASGTATSQTSTTAGASSAPAPAAEDMTLYTKYDFIPGDKVIFYDDMSDELEGEFPYRWNLERGVFEVVRLGGEFWIMCTDDGTVYPKIPHGPLPEMYTVELEFYDNGPDMSGHYFYIRWFDDRNKSIGELGVVSHKSTWLAIKGKTKSNKHLPNELSKGVHTMRIMATRRSIKCYIDEVRVANVPKIEGFNPTRFGVYLRPYDDSPCLFRGFRFAEGGKSMRDQLDETGKIITHGILFDADEYKIKGESFKTLKNIGRLLEDDPDLRLSIEGHTDSDGTEAHNSELSQNRSKAVRNYLIATYGIADDRLEVRGWGESKPIDTNDSPEGKANNRRVELVKL